MKNFYSICCYAILAAACLFFPQKTNATENNFSYYCDSTEDPVQALPWLSNLIDDVNNDDCLCDIAVYCYNGNVYFSPLSNPTVRCSDVIYKTYDVHGDLFCQQGGLLGINSCPSNFGNATLIRTIRTCQTTGSNLTVHCPSDIYVDCNDDTRVCWNLPTATTDCNTCPSNDIPGYIYMGTKNGHKYYCSKDIATWEKAQAACQALGGYLAVVTSYEENHLLASFLDNQSAFIGGHDRDRNGHYQWINGESFGYTNWYPGQPNNYRGDQFYLELLPNGQWNDEYPSRKNEYICEIPCSSGSPTITGPATCGNFSIGTTPIKYTIADDCGNSEECKFNVVVESSIDLHCPDDIHIQLGSHETSAHVDWDAPTLNSCCGTCSGGGGGSISGFIYMGQHGDSHYYCSKDPASWSSAKNICASNGGHLAKVTSSEENYFLANQLQTQTAWIGLSDKNNEGHFTWCDGTELGSYQPWYPGQPNNYNGRQHYVELLSNGKWNDQYHYALEFIMEIPACDPIQQISGPNSGSDLSAGNRTVQYKATDACGNTATCSFNINVKAAQSVGYCSAGGHSASSVWIQKVQFANIWSQSGNNGGYKYFDSECGSTTAGQYVDLELMPGFKSTVHTCYWLVYVDYNNDGDFTDHGEYVAKGSGTGKLSGTIRISPNAKNGKTRVRCVMRVGGWPPGSCGSYSYGETEDYCITIAGGYVQSEGQAETRSRIDEDVITLDTEKSIVNADVQVYPNPTNGLINVVNGGELAIERIEVIDQAGRKVRVLNNPAAANTQIDLSAQLSGLYFVRTMFTNGDLSVSKISLVK